MDESRPIASHNNNGDVGMKTMQGAVGARQQRLRHVTADIILDLLSVPEALFSFPRLLCR